AAETALAAAQTAAAEQQARRAALERALRDERLRAERFSAERARLSREAAQAPAGLRDLEEVRATLAAAAEESEMAEEAALAARDALASARDAEARGRPTLTEAEREAARLDTEARTLAKLVAPAAQARFAPVIDAVTVAPGYEAALAAALGEDLDASTDAAAPTRWAGAPHLPDDPPLPPGTEPLARFVTAPELLARRLAQIAVAPRATAGDLRAALRPGQRLVTREGDIHRWDGFTVAAEAPAPAARRLAERNRLDALRAQAARAREAAEAAREGFEAVQAAVREAAAAEARALDGARLARRGFDAAREALAGAERREAEGAAKRAALAEALARVTEEAEEAAARMEAAAEALAELPEDDAAARTLAAARASAEAGRAEAAEAKAARLALTRADEERRRRRETLDAERARWRERAGRAEAALDEFAERLGRAEEELGDLAEAPDTFLVERRRLAGATEAAEAARREAADRLAAAETARAEADTRARSALDALAAAREGRAAALAGHEALERRLAEIARSIHDALDTDPDGLFALAGVAPGDSPPEAAGIEAHLSGLKADRERLGAVNLRAEAELEEAEGRRDDLGRERDDLIEAIRRLRGGIASLNREGRERLLAAFAAVNGHFERLFTTLFGGGTAELTLVDSDDPLEAGLEILARPPGKKPQTMTLLSGGEQALTATALIFAVFLTNPSPVCVLDEVDAPLDDANVERYCDLLDAMARDTDTRFLVITHNPITMARMNRLFGVTMAERGVSQLVSVDLATAESLREAV
ncbi:chromosome segregation protein SMC, partial [Methylobacterium oryzisoli]